MVGSRFRILVAAGSRIFQIGSGAVVFGAEFSGSFRSDFLRAGRGSFRKKSARERMELSPAEKVPAVDGKSVPLQDYEQQGRLWMRAIQTGPASRPSTFVLHMTSVPRQVLLSAGGDHSDDQGGVARKLEIL